MKTARTQLTLLLAVLGVTVGLVAPGSAAAGGCPAEKHPIYSLYVLNGAGCGAGETVANRLAERFDSPRDFAGDFSREFIHQRDAQGRRWKCQWNSASVHDDLVSWSCARRGGRLVSWMWRAARP
jgi:hypothetical protein